MENEEIVLLVLIIGFGLLIPAMIYGLTKYEQKHPCLESHKEVQYNVPPSVVVGQNGSFGGVAVPLGKATPEKRTICDKRQ